MVGKGHRFENWGEESSMNRCDISRKTSWLVSPLRVKDKDDHLDLLFNTSRPHQIPQKKGNPPKWLKRTPFKIELIQVNEPTAKSSNPWSNRYIKINEHSLK